MDGGWFGNHTAPSFRHTSFSHQEIWHFERLVLRVALAIRTWGKCVSMETLVGLSTFVVPSMKALSQRPRVGLVENREADKV